MSTVGYGDISPQTTLTKIWISLFILVSFAIFASFIPEVAEILFSGSKYGGSYTKNDEYKHIVVCGNLEFSPVQSFLADFFNVDRPASKIHVVFVNSNEPDFRLVNLLKENFMRVKYVKGTVMDQLDLKRVAIDTADACFILANHNCKSPKDEDASNIMRVIALKNHTPNLRVFVQIIQYENKSYLTNISTWNSQNGDAIFCFSEIEQKILAKSCLIPGYSTFIVNLFSIRSENQCKKFRKPGNSWINDYIHGLGMELYTSGLSPSLVGMTFYDLFLFCYKYLRILLIAVEIKFLDGKTGFVNPSSQSHVTKNTIGYFICKSFNHAERAALYCSLCHGASEETHRKVDRFKCKCLKNIVFQNEKEKYSRFQLARQQFHYIVFSKLEKEKDIYTSAYREFDNCLVRNPMKPIDFSNHILVCIFADEDSPPIGLKNFVLLLRSKKLKAKEIRPIVLASNANFLQREWASIAQFQDIHPVSFNNINGKSLSLLRVENCHACLILSAKIDNRNSENVDLTLVDKEIILATLNVKSIFKNINFLSMESGFGSKNKRVLISKLFIESNVQFLDQEDNDEPDCPVFLAETFACGHTFTTEMLDCLLSNTYFNPGIMKLIQILTVGEIHCLEDLGDNCKDGQNNNIKCQIKLTCLTKNKFQSCFLNKDTCLYKDLFEYSFRHYHMIFLGIYREIAGAGSKSSGIKKKVIITNPEPSFLVRCDDSALVLNTASSQEATFCDPPIL